MSNYQSIIRSRYVALAAVVIAVLGVLAARLWTMQVLQGPAYAADAEQNRVREVTLEAPRGRILDRNGKPLVTNRATLAVVAQPTVAKDDAVIQNLSSLLEVPVGEIKEKLASTKESALAARTIAIDVPEDKIAYLAEHESEFPGVEIRSKAVREYPQGRLAAHILGYTGEISEKQLSEKEFKGYESTDVVGKAGAEVSFESVLQGDRGMRRLEVDASGNPRRIITEIEPVAGRDVVLTIDSDIQKVVEKALADALVDAHKSKHPHARAGAAVALDLTNGEVIALASLPTYDPTVFIGGVSKKTWASLTDKSSEYPLTNRAIAGLYPPASTFKAITGLAGLRSGIASPGSSYYCSGTWTGLGEEWSKKCWLHSGHKHISFMDGVAESCDTVFYEIGQGFYKGEREGIQKMAREFGYGSKLGIDLPGEASGRVPDAAWKKEFNRDYPEFQQWVPGDTVNIAIGQGDMLVTPLQVAASYSAIANDGKLMQPHVLKQVLGSDGKAVLTTEPEVALEPKVSEANLKTMQSALERVISSGTGRSAFRGFGVKTAGKSGTAQVAGKDDYAWFVGYGPASNPKYCVAVVVEQGGSGGSVAGPATRQILAALLGEKIEHVQATDNSR